MWKDYNYDILKENDKLEFRKLIKIGNQDLKEKLRCKERIVAGIGCSREIERYDQTLLYIERTSGKCC